MQSLNILKSVTFFCHLGIYYFVDFVEECFSFIVVLHLPFVDVSKVLQLLCFKRWCFINRSYACFAVFYHSSSQSLNTIIKVFHWKHYYGPNVKVSTSVHLFFSLVRNCWTKNALVTVSRWEFLSTVSNRVDTNCWYRWINALIWLSATSISSHPLRASSCLLIRLIPSLINKTSNSLWMTEISDLRNITITLLLTSFIDIFCDNCKYWYFIWVHLLFLLTSSLDHFQTQMMICMICEVVSSLYFYRVQQLYLYLK